MQLLLSRADGTPIATAWGVTRYRRVTTIVIVCATILAIASSTTRATRSTAMTPSFPWDPPLPHVDAPSAEFGRASWYGDFHHGLQTANGERFDQWAMTAAHRTLPLGTRIEVTNLTNGRRVQVRVNDRGPMIANRIVDLSRAAAAHIGAVEAGVVRVRLRQVEGR